MPATSHDAAFVIVSGPPASGKSTLAPQVATELGLPFIAKDTIYYLPETEENQEIRHVLSELLNSMFDIDKMLYFVAPEWWKPRKHASQYLGKPTPKVLGKNRPGVQGVLGNELVTNWSDNQVRADNCYITSESESARLGSSLGWVLQLDGDDHRNAFRGSKR